MMFYSCTHMATVGVKGLTTNVSVYFTIISEQKVYFENYRAYYRHVAFSTKNDQKVLGLTELCSE